MVKNDEVKNKAPQAPAKAKSFKGDNKIIMIGNGIIKHKDGDIHCEAGMVMDVNDAAFQALKPAAEKFNPKSATHIAIAEKKAASLSHKSFETK